MISTRALCPVLAVATVIATGGSAVAQPRVLVFADSPDGDTGLIEKAVTSAGFTPVDGKNEVRKSLAAITSLQNRAARGMETLLKEADQAYLEQNWKVSLKILGRAEERALLSAEPAKLLWEVSLRRAVAYVGRGGIRDRKKAQKWFAFMLALLPDKPLPRGLYGPDVSNHFARVLARRRPEVGESVRFKTVPKSATVLVDGRRSGKKMRLRRGIHWVQSVAPGYLPTSIIAEVKGPSVRFSLDKDEGSLRAKIASGWAVGGLSVRDAASRKLLLRLARKVGAASVLWLDTSGSPRVTVFTKETQTSAGGVDAASAARKSLAAVSADGIPREPTERRRVAGSRSIATRWWFWAGVATVAAASVTTAVILSSDGGNGMPGPGPGPGPGPDPERTVNIGISP